MWRRVRMASVSRWRSECARSPLPAPALAVGDAGRAGLATSSHCRWRPEAACQRPAAGSPMAISSRSLSLFSSASSNSMTKKHHERRLIKLPSQLLYTVVADVDNYKEFVPWCKSSTVVQRSDSALTADLEVGFQFFTEKYTSQVTLQPSTTVTAVSNQTNLFEYLRSEWKFTPSSSDPQRSTWVNFSIEFKFRSALYNEISELFLQEVVKKMVQAFEKRCKDLTAQASTVSKAGATATAASAPRP